MMSIIVTNLYTNFFLLKNLFSQFAFCFFIIFCCFGFYLSVIQERHFKNGSSEKKSGFCSVI